MGEAGASFRSSEAAGTGIESSQKWDARDGFAAGLFEPQGVNRIKL